MKEKQKKKELAQLVEQPFYGRLSVQTTYSLYSMFRNRKKGFFQYILLAFSCTLFFAFLLEGSIRIIGRFDPCNLQSERILNRDKIVRKKRKSNLETFFVLVHLESEL